MPSLRRLLPVHRILYWVVNAYFYLFFGLLGAGLNSWVTGSGLSLHWWLTLVLTLIVLGVPLLWWRLRLAPRIQARPEVMIDRSPKETEGHARRGLIAFVSLYTAQPGSGGAQLSADERDQALSAGDWQVLDLPRSNFFTLISAIESHKSKLDHCWLIATAATPNQPGSVGGAHVVQNYLQSQGIHCNFCIDEVPQEDDALLCAKVRQLVDGIFQKAIGHGLAAADVICDCTGGIRSAQLGMILACLDSERDLQLMGTRYDANGRPTGSPFRMRIHFEPLEVPHAQQN
jgi:hypothetical protein